MRRVLKELVVDRIAAVDRPCQEGATVILLKRDFSDKEREDAADSGAALPSGGFPIKSKQDLKNAVQAFGRAKNKAATKTHIVSRAKSLGATDLLPENWNVKKVEDSAELLFKNLFMLMPTTTPEEDDSAHNDFNAELEECMEVVAHCEAREELWPYIHALKDSLTCLVADHDMDPSARQAQMHDNVNQFMAALDSAFPGLAEKVEEEVVGKRSFDDLKKRLLLSRINVLKHQLDKAKLKSREDNEPAEPGGVRPTATGGMMRKSIPRVRLNKGISMMPGMSGVKGGSGVKIRRPKRPKMPKMVKFEEEVEKQRTAGLSRGYKASGVMRPKKPKTGVKKPPRPKVPHAHIKKPKVYNPFAGV